MSELPFIREAATGIDLSSRVQTTTTVAASPAAGSETVICSLTISSALAVQAGVLLIGWCAYTVGTNGTAVTLKLRQTGTSGTTLASSGATDASAAALAQQSICGFDTGATLPGQVYVLTMTVANGSAESAVSGALLSAIVV
jgi:hypothetical protein